MVVCGVGTIYKFRGKETDTASPYCDQKVIVFVFKSAESDFYLLCARDSENVALQVVQRVLIAVWN